jgi:hypothetical protein
MYDLMIFRRVHPILYYMVMLSDNYICIHADKLVSYILSQLQASLPESGSQILLQRALSESVPRNYAAPVAYIFSTTCIYIHSAAFSGKIITLCTTKICTETGSEQLYIQNSNFFGNIRAFLRAYIFRGQQAGRLIAQLANHL